MKYHFVKPDLYLCKYGRTHICDHPVYSKCTLYFGEGRGLAVIQQRYNEHTKSTSWGEIDPWLVDSLYFNENFQRVFNERADKPVRGLYPTMTIRQIMWALRMKPLKKERWETCFDRRDI